MEISEFAFTLLVLFFPGLVCAYIVDHLTIHRPCEKFFFVLQSFVFGITSYIFYWIGLKIAHHCFPFVDTSLSFARSFSFPENSEKLRAAKSLSDTVQVLSEGAVDGATSVPFDFEEIFFVTCVAIIVGLVASLAANKHWLHRFATWAGLTEKFGQLDVWAFFFGAKEHQTAWVTVRDHKHNLMYLGWVVAHSDDVVGSELFLQDVDVYRNDSGNKLYSVDSLYISRQREDISVQIDFVEKTPEESIEEGSPEKTTIPRSKEEGDG